MKTNTILAGIFVAMVSLSLSARAVNIQAGGAVQEPFAIGVSATAALPTDWKADKQTTARLVGTYAAAVTATALATSNNMSATAANGIYNYGAGNSMTERAVGFISSGTATKSGNLYVKLVNNGSVNITSLTISYNIEKYRNGSNAAGFQYQLYYSTTDSSYTSAGSDFLTSFAADANNNGFALAPGSTTAVTNKTLAVNIPVGGTVYLVWNYSVVSGTTTTSAQGLGVDDVTIQANAPGIVVLGTNAAAIANNSATPTVAEGTDYGTVTVGQNADHTFQITNSGAAALNISSTAWLTGTEGFSVLSAPATVAAGGISNLVVRFTPASAGSKADRLTINNDATNYAFSLAGTGQAASAPTLVAGALSAFSKRAINTTSAPAAFTLEGSSLAPADGNITVTAPAGFLTAETNTGPFAGSFQIAYTGGTLPQRPVYVAFAPTAAASYSGILTNLGGGATATVSVAGSGMDKPTATSAAASGLSASAATLNGTVNANNDDATVTFEYGTNTDYGITNAATPATVSGTGNTSVSAALSGLTPNREYHFRVVATNTAGATYGADQGFTTLVALPRVSTYAPTETNLTGATLSGSVNPSNSSASLSFEYGLTTNFGAEVSAAPATASGTNTVSASNVLSSLQSGQTYYYRFKGVNAAGTNYGATVSFTTLILAAPANVIFPATNTTAFDVSWDAVAGATAYQLDVATGSGFIDNGSSYLVNFEDGSKGGYAAADVTLNGRSWNMTDALIGTSASDRKNGSKSARVQNSGTVSLNTATNMMLSSITFVYAKYGTDANSAGRVEYSANDGSTWSTAGTFAVTSTTLTPFEATNLNVVGNIRVRFIKTDATTARMNVDDITLYPTAGAPSYSILPAYSNLTVTATNLAVSGLAESTLYYVRLRATNAISVGAYSAPRSVRTLLTLLASAGPHGSISPAGPLVMAWNDSREFTLAADAYYKIAAVTTNGGAVSGLPVSTNAWAYTWAGITGGVIQASFIPDAAKFNPDSDGDGQSDGLEALVTGTDPNNAGDFFHQEVRPQGEEMVVSWSNAAGRIYRVYSSANLTSGVWSLEAAYTNPPAGASTAWTSAPVVGAQYYRVQVVSTNM